MAPPRATLVCIARDDDAPLAAGMKDLNFADTVSSLLCAGCEGVTYDEALARPPQRSNDFYDKVSSLDGVQALSTLAKPDELKRVDEKTSILEDTVRQLKEEVTRLERDKKKQPPNKIATLDKENIQLHRLA